MHKGVVLATVMIGVLAVCLATAMVLEPILTATYAVMLRNPATGQRVACRVSLPRGQSPQYKFDMCVMACRARGYSEGRPENDGVIDFFDRARYLQQMKRVEAFIPPACRVV
jgi:hypothetical protein